MSTARKCKRREAIRLLRSSNAGIELSLATINAQDLTARGYDRIVATEPEPVANGGKTWFEWGFDVSTVRLGRPALWSRGAMHCRPRAERCQ